MPSQTPSEDDSTPNAPETPRRENARLKREIEKLKAQLRSPSKKKRRKNRDDPLLRGVRRLVDLYQPIDTLVDAVDSHQALQESADAGDEQAKAALDGYDRDFNSGIILLKKCRRLRKIFNEGEGNLEGDAKLTKIYDELRDAGNKSRSDDLRRAKEEIANELNMRYRQDKENIALDKGDKHGRGFTHFVTGRLLCPGQYDWDDESIRAKIREGRINLSGEYFLPALYSKHRLVKRNENPRPGFLKSRLLVVTFLVIFTSPSSAQTLGEERDDGGPILRNKLSAGLKKGTKPHVAHLLDMDCEVTPRSIAYAAVMLLFSLSDAPHWTRVHNGFNYHMFYNFVVDYFENPKTTSAGESAARLLRWWNETVFPERVTKATSEEGNASVAWLDEFDNEDD